MSLPAQRRVRRRENREHKEGDHVLRPRGRQPGSPGADETSFLRCSRKSHDKRLALTADHVLLVPHL